MADQQNNLFYNHIIRVRSQGLDEFGKIEQRYSQLSRSIQQDFGRQVAGSANQIGKIVNDISTAAKPKANFSRVLNDVSAFASETKKSIGTLETFEQHLRSLSNVPGISPKVKESATQLAQAIHQARIQVGQDTKQISSDIAVKIASGPNSIASKFGKQLSAGQRITPQGAKQDVLNIGGQNLVGNAIRSDTQRQIFDTTKAIQNMFARFKVGADISTESIEQLRGKLRNVQELLSSTKIGNAANVNSALQQMDSTLAQYHDQLLNAQNSAIGRQNIAPQVSAFNNAVSQQQEPFARIAAINDRIQQAVAQGVTPLNVKGITQGIGEIVAVLHQLGPENAGVIEELTQEGRAFKQLASDALEAASAIQKKKAADLSTAQTNQLNKTAQQVTRARQPLFRQQQQEEVQAEKDTQRQQQLYLRDEQTNATNVLRTRKAAANYQAQLDRQAQRDAARADAEQARISRQQQRANSSVVNTTLSQSQGGEVSYLPQRGKLAAQALNQLSAAAGGTLLAINALNGGITGLVFGLIFMKFNLVGTQLAVASLVIGLLSLLRFVKSSISAFAGFDSSIQLLRNLTGSMQEANAQFQYGSKVARQFGFDTNDVLSGLVDLNKNFLENAQTIQAVSDLAAGMGVSYDQAAQIFTQAVGQQTGSLTTLQQAGFKVTQMQAFQFDLQTRLSRLTEATALIEDKYSGAAVRHAQTLSGAWTRLTDAAKYFLQEVGGPIVKLVLVPLITGFANLFNRIADGAQAFFNSASGLKLLGQIGNTVQRILKDLGLVATSTSDTFKNRVSSALYVFFSILKLVLVGIANFIELIQTAYGAISGFFQRIKLLIDGFRAFAQFLKNLNFQALFQNIKQAAFDLPNYSKAIALAISKMIPDGFVDFAEGLFAKAIKGIVDGIESLREIKFGDIGDALKGLFEDLKTLPDDIAAFFRDLPEQVSGKVKDFWDGLVEALFKPRGSLRDSIAKALPESDLAKALEDEAKAFNEAVLIAFRHGVRDVPSTVLDDMAKAFGEEGTSGAERVLAVFVKSLEDAAKPGLFARFADAIKEGIIFAIADILGNAIINSLPLNQFVHNIVSGLFNGALWGIVVNSALRGEGNPAVIIAGAIGGALELELKKTLPYHLANGIQGAFLGGAAGATIGFGVAGPLGAAVGAVLGAAIGGAIEYAIKTTNWGKLFDGLRNYDYNSLGRDVQSKLNDALSGISGTNLSVNLGISPELQASFTDFFAAIGNAVKSVAPIFDSLSVTIQEFVTTSKKFLEETLGPVIIIVAEFFKTVKAAWDSDILGIQEDLGAFIKFTLAAWQQFMAGFVEAFATGINLVVGGMKIFAGLLEATLGALLAVLRGDWSGAWQDIKDGLALAFSGMLQILNAFKDEFVLSFKSIYNVMLPAAVQLGVTIIEGILYGIGDLTKVGAKIGRDLLEGIASTPFDIAKDWATRLKDSILTGLGKLIGHSPSPQGIEIGQDLIDGIQKGINDNQGKLDGSLKDITVHITGNVSINAQANQFGAQIIQSIFDGMNSGKSDNAAKFADAINSIFSTLSGLNVNQNAIDSISKISIQPIIDAVNSIVTGLSNATKGLSSDDVQKFSSAASTALQAISTGVDALTKISQLSAPNTGFIGDINGYVTKIVDMISNFAEQITNRTGKDWVNSASSWLTEADQAINTLSNATDVISKIDGLGSNISTNFDTFTKAILGAITVFANLQQSKWAVAAVSLAANFAANAGDLFTKLSNAADTIQKIQDSGDAIGTAFQHFHDSVAGGVYILGSVLVALSTANGITGQIQQTLNNLATISGFSIGDSIAQGIAQGLEAGAVSDYMKAAAGFVISAILNYLRQLAGAHSPAQKFMPLGGDISAGVAQGITEQGHLLRRATTGVINNALGSQALTPQGALGAPTGGSASVNITVQISDSVIADDRSKKILADLVSSEIMNNMKRNTRLLFR